MSHGKYSLFRKNVPVVTANANDVTARNGPLILSAGMPSARATAAPVSPAAPMQTKKSLPCNASVHATARPSP